VSTPIPFGADRRAQMRAYSRRHYGIDSYRMVGPNVIVQHYTVGDTVEHAYRIFARNAPDADVRERPGTCAHYVIGKDGTIHQLVPPNIMCRHAPGLNYTAIGIEHVGRSDEDVMGNRRQLAASLALTRWLQDRYGIATRDVIGHNENVASRWHRERVASYRDATHQDFPKAVMDVYRARL
jgi:N-acetylmuramoyl-L-alanine amidase